MIKSRKRMHVLQHTYWPPRCREALRLKPGSISLMKCSYSSQTQRRVCGLWQENKRQRERKISFLSSSSASSPSPVGAGDFVGRRAPGSISGGPDYDSFKEGRVTLKTTRWKPAYQFAFYCWSPRGGTFESRIMTKGRSSAETHCGNNGLSAIVK